MISWWAVLLPHICPYIQSGWHVCASLYSTIWYQIIFKNCCCIVLSSLHCHFFFLLLLCHLICYRIKWGLCIQHTCALVSNQSCHFTHLLSVCILHFSTEVSHNPELNNLHSPSICFNIMLLSFCSMLHGFCFLIDCLNILHNQHRGFKGLWSLLSMTSKCNELLCTKEP